MLLFIEIALTMAAWKRGWKGWALLPIVIAMGIGFMSGLFMVSEESAFAFGLMLDLMCAAALVGMVVAKKKVATSESSLNRNQQEALKLG